MRCPWVLVLVVGALCSLTSDAFGQRWMGLALPSGSLGSEGYSIWQTGPSETRRYSSLREWVQLETRGHLFSPRFLAFTVQARPTLGQARSSLREPGAETDSNGLVGSVSMATSPGAGLSATAVAQWTEDFQPDLLGGFRSLEQRRRNLYLSDSNPLLPVRFTAEDHLETYALQSVRSPGVIEWGRRFRRYSYEAHNWKTLLRLRHTEGANLRESGWEPFRRREAHASNRQRWGKGSFVVNSVDLLDRAEDRVDSDLGFRSKVHLQQTAAIATDLSYEQRLNRSGAIEGSMRSVDGRVGYTTSSGLGARLMWVRTSSEFGDARRIHTTWTPSGRFSREVTTHLSVTGNLEGTYIRRQEEADQTRFNHVVQERHALGPDGRFRLENPFVDRTTVVVEDVETGEIYREGLDYRILEEGPFLAVLELPGGRLAEASQLSVSYRYQIPQSISTSSIGLRASLSARWRGVTAFYSGFLRDDLGDLVGVGLPIVQDVVNQAVGVSARGPLGPLQINANVSEAWISAASFASRRTTLNTRVIAGSPRLLAAQVSARVSKQRSEERAELEQAVGGVREGLIQELEATLARRLTRALEAEGALSYHRFREGSTSERLLRISSLLSFERGGATMTLQVDRIGWRGAVARGQSQVSLKLRQRF